MNSHSYGNAVHFLVQAMQGNMHTAFPGRIEKYDFTTQKAEVKPLIKHRYRNGDEQELPKISDVPVVFMRTLEAYVILPVKKGSTVLVICAERSMDNWLSQGGIASPGLTHQFSLSDAIAIPGLFPFTEASPVSADDVLEMRYKGVGVQITADGDVKVGGASFKKLVNEEFQSLFNNHVHSYYGFVGTGAQVPNITSSPSALVGANPPNVPPPAAATPIVHAFVDDLDDSHLTDKVTAE